MGEIMWILGLFGVFIVGMFYGIWCNKQSGDRNMEQIRNDVYDIIYDWGTHPSKKIPNVFRLKNLDKYFNLDDIRMERDDEPFDNNDIYSTDDISTRITNADGTQGIRRGLSHEYD